MFAPKLDEMFTPSFSSGSGVLWSILMNHPTRHSRTAASPTRARAARATNATGRRKGCDGSRSGRRDLTREVYRRQGWVHSSAFAAGGSAMQGEEEDDEDFDSDDEG